MDGAQPHRGVLSLGQPSQRLRSRPRPRTERASTRTSPLGDNVRATEHTCFAEEGLRATCVFSVRLSLSP